MDRSALIIILLGFLLYHVFTIPAGDRCIGRAVVCLGEFLRSSCGGGCVFVSALTARRTHVRVQQRLSSSSSSSSSSTTTTERKLVLLLGRGRQRRPYYEDHNDDNNNVGYDELSRQISTDRPTATRTETIGPPIVPSKPKIVVFGASGGIGRLVVKQLLEMDHLDATILACVRNYDKACRVLFDDLCVPTTKGGGGKKSTRLQIVQADLVPPEELPEYQDGEEEERLWKQTAESAARFYGKKIKDYDNRQLLPDANELLQDTIRDCTTIINCVGSVRPTNLWTDILARPIWRLLRRDVSAWCTDGRHPFYVHYAGTRKILGYAEREQLRREAAGVEAAAKEKEEGTIDPDHKKNKPIIVPKIRFIRISDLCVSQHPWSFIPLLTNVIYSMVFRYQDMTERLLERSPLIESVILRPGDLVDDERDANTTSLQVDTTGRVPYPARVGREDVAALVVAAALFKSPNQQEEEENHHNNHKYEEEDDTTNLASSFANQQPLHYTLAVRWVGEDMGSYPSQGRKNDGMSDANKCMQRVLRIMKKKQNHEENKIKKEQQHRRHTKSKLLFFQNHKRKDMNKMKKLFAGANSNYDCPESVIRFDHSLRQRRNLKPYGICTAIFTYTILMLMARSILHPLTTVLSQQTWLMNHPIMAVLVKPLLSRTRDILKCVLAIGIARVSLLQRWIVSHIPLQASRLFKGKAVPNYISF